MNLRALLALLVGVLLSFPAPAFAAPATTPNSRPAPAARHAIRGFGSVRFRDRHGHSNRVTARLRHATPPPPGFHYDGWLTGDDGSWLDIGPIALDPGGAGQIDWIAPDGANLLARYSRFVFTPERDGTTPAAPTAPPAFAGQIDPALRDTVRALLITGPDTPLPDRPGLAFAAAVQASGLEQEARRAVSYAAGGKIVRVRQTNELMRNRIVGVMDGSYGDWNGNGVIDNAGDTYGIQRYARTIADTVRPVTLDQSLNPAYRLIATQMISATTNMLTWSQQARELASLIQPNTSPADTQVIQADVDWLARGVYRGIDLNNDGTIAAAGGESGAADVYSLSQQLASFPLTPAR